MRAGTPSQVDCHSGEATAAGGCEVDVEVTPSLTDAGGALIGANALPNLKVHAVVAKEADHWQVRELRTEEPLTESSRPMPSESLMDSTLRTPITRRKSN